MPFLPQIPGYSIQNKLGSGGMGVVYSAKRDGTEETFAVKFLLAERDANLEDRVRFRIEAEAYACLDHKSIIKIRDIGVVSGYPYLVTDFAENGSLSDYLRSNAEVGLEWRVQTIKQVSDALIHAHERHIVHRDLKPANILVTADRSPRVADFGLVKFSSPISEVSRHVSTFSFGMSPSGRLRALDFESRRERQAGRSECGLGAIIESFATECGTRTGLTTDAFNLQAIEDFVRNSDELPPIIWEVRSDELTKHFDNMTQRGDVVGTPNFMAPEQASGQIDQIGPQSDVYGLGATLYYVLTEQFPVRGATVREVLSNVESVVPTLPSYFNKAIPEELDRVVMKALEKRTEDRYSSMLEFGDDLDHFLNSTRTSSNLKLRAP